MQHREVQQLHHVVDVTVQLGHVRRKEEVVRPVPFPCGDRKQPGEARERERERERKREAHSIVV